MIVCVCRRVSDRDIARLARNGMGFDEIQFELGVATQCGRCEGSTRRSAPAAWRRPAA
jgi:bacterioferritin-associated ferredoxin